MLKSFGQKGVAQVVILALLIVGLGVGVYVVQHRTNVLPFAQDHNTDSNTAVKSSTIGIFKGGVWHLRGSNSEGVSDKVFTFGNPGDLPVVGDWTGKGYKSIGVFRGNTVYLRNSNDSGLAENTFTYGLPTGDVLVVGDWDGNGTDTVGVYRGDTFFLRNSNTSGFADVVVRFGEQGDIPLAGKWDGHKTSIGVFRQSSRGDTPNGISVTQFILKNSTGPNDTGVTTITFGQPGDIPIVGDWDGNGTDTVGVFRPGDGKFYLKNSNSDGPADLIFKFNYQDDPAIKNDATPVAVAGFWGTLTNTNAYTPVACVDWCQPPQFVCQQNLCKKAANSSCFADNECASGLTCQKQTCPPGAIGQCSGQCSGASNSTESSIKVTSPAPADLMAQLKQLLRQLGIDLPNDNQPSPSPNP